MYKTLQYSLIFVSLVVLISAAIGDAFDRTVTQIKALKVELEQNQTAIAEKSELIETQIADFRENHPLNAPKDQFESNADYAARLKKLESAISQRLAELEAQHLATLQARRLEIQTERVRLHRTVFLTSDITATLGEYDANNEFFPITFRAGAQSIKSRLRIKKDDARNLHANWKEVSATGWIVIDPGYRRGLAKVKLAYSPLWEGSVTWTFDEVYHLGNNHRAVAFSADGKYIATGSTDGNTSIWEVSSGRELRQIEHSGKVYAVSFSPDGKYLATGDSQYVRLWQVDNSKLIWRKYVRVSSGLAIVGPSLGAHYAVSFSPDGKYLADANRVGIIVNEVNGGRDFWGKNRNASTFGWSYSAAFEAVSFSPDGQYLATGDTFNDAIIWDVRNGTAIHYIEHSDEVSEVAFSPNGQYLITGDKAGNVAICEVSSGQKLQELPHGGWIGAVTFSPDGAYLAVGHEKSITFYRMGQETISIDSEIIKEKSIQASASGAVYELAWHPDGSLISDGRKVYRTLLQPIFIELVAQPVNTRRDVNRDGVVDVDDLVIVVANFGKSFAADANPNPDVNRDGVVNLTDIIEIVLALQAAAGAPSAHSQLTAETLQHWIDHAKQLSNRDAAFQRGIRALEQLLTTLTETSAIPEKTALLPNYPNPFNPETWIPYQLAAAADVTVRLYSANGTLVRTLELGHRLAGIYQARHRAAYWDGRNEFGEPVASGVYFYTLTAGDFTATRKMLIRK